MTEVTRSKQVVWSRLGDGLIWLLVPVIVVWPIGRLLYTACRELFGTSQPIQSIFQANVLASLYNSIESSILATLLASLIGFGIALTLSGWKSRLSAWGHLMALVPLLIPPFVGAFSWVQAYAKAGMTDWLFHWYWPGLFGSPGVIVLLAVHSSPIAYLAAAAARARISLATKRAAQINGANSWITFCTVTWPIVQPALLTAAGLIFAYNLGDFGIPFELGAPAHFSTATLQIYQDLSTESAGGLPSAILLSIILSIISLLVLFLFHRLNSARSLAVYHLNVYTVPREKWTVWRTAAFALFGLYTVIAVILPFLSALLVGLTRAYGLTPIPSNWDLAYFFNVFASDTGSSALNSGLLATAAAVLIAVMGSFTAEFAQRSKWGKRLNKMAWLPYALPGSVVGVAAILAYSRILYGTLLIILLAYLARFWGVSDVIVQVRRQLPVMPIRAARIFGASGRLAYRAAVWPYLSASIGTTALLVFVSAVYELTISSLLYTPSSETIAVVVMSANQAGDVRTTAVISVWMTLGMVLAVLLFTYFRNRTLASEEMGNSDVRSD